MRLLRWLCIATMLRHCSAVCEKACSNHGTCNMSTCTCYSGYTGGDCSLRLCPTGPAFVSKASKLDSAHEPVACSAAGICNTATGQCICNSGWSGVACQVVTCPRGCSGNGQCVPMSSLAKKYGRLPYLDSGGSYGALHGYTYGGWEGSVLMACICDAGFYGVDCSFKTCPKGDDPLTTGQRAKAVRIAISNPRRGLTANDVVQLSFEAETASFAPATDTAGAIELAIERTPNVQDAVVTKVGDASVAGGTAYVYVVITQFSNTANNWFSHEGDPPLASFFCDTTGTHGGLTVSLKQDVPDATYTIQIAPSGADFRWLKAGVDAWSAPIAMSSAGNAELSPVSGNILLQFSPVTGRVAGEQWKVVISGGTASIIPETVCDVSDVDMSVAAGGTYTGMDSTTYILRIEPAPISDVSGLAYFSWRWQRADGSSGADAAVTAITPGVAQSIGSDGFQITFASGYGHTVGAAWTVVAQAPSATVSTAVAPFMTGRGLATSVASSFRLWLVDTSVVPATFGFETFDRSVPGGASVAGQAASMAPIQISTTGTAIPQGLSPGTDATGFSAYFSSVTAFPPASEWVVLLANGGASATIPRPNAPLVVQASAGTVVASSHTITIDASGMAFTFTSVISTSPPTSLSGTVSILDWWAGNGELGNGLTARFFTKSGYRSGTSWSISVTPGGAVTYLSAPLSDLRVSTSGVTTAAEYYVRIVSCANAADRFTWSRDGSAWSAAVDVKPATDSTGNVELGNGIRLTFLAATGYAPGQTWHIATQGAYSAISVEPSVKEFATCSNRGLCSSVTGQCSCFTGFVFSDCSSEGSTLGSTTASATLAALVLDTTSPLFSGNVLKLTSSKAASDFNFVAAFAAGSKVFSLRGDGLMLADSISTGNLVVGQSLTVQGEGISVTNGGALINKGTLPATDVMTVMSTTPGSMGYTGSVLRLDAVEDSTVPAGSSSGDHYLLRAYGSVQDVTTPLVAPTSTERFSVRGDGRTTVSSGGLRVLNSVTATVDDATARGQPFFGGAYVEGGVTVQSYGVTISNGGLQVVNSPRVDYGAGLAHKPGNSSAVADETIFATAADAAFSGSVIRANAVSSSSGAYNLLRLQAAGTDSFVVRGDGFTKIAGGGLSIHSGGVSSLLVYLTAKCVGRRMMFTASDSIAL